MEKMLCKYEPRNYCDPLNTNCKNNENKKLNRAVAEKLQVRTESSALLTQKNKLVVSQGGTR